VIFDTKSVGWRAGSKLNKAVLEVAGELVGLADGEAVEV
jgi:hypothetical protein